MSLRRASPLLLCIALASAVELARPGATSSAANPPPTHPSVRWHRPDVTTLTIFDLSTAKPDEGVVTRPNPGGLELSLNEVPYSHILLRERPEYDEQGVVQIQITDVKRGSVTLQAVCYDAEGTVLKHVDLMNNIDAPGTYEVAMRIYRTPLKGTKLISFKLWLAGDNQPSATVSGVAWGMIQ